MSKNSEACIKKAAKGIAEIPEDYKNMRIKNSIPNRGDWDDFNRLLCACLHEKGCPIEASELDPFWEENKTFGELIDYIDEQCGYTS